MQVTQDRPSGRVRPANRAGRLALIVAAALACSAGAGSWFAAPAVGVQQSPAAGRVAVVRLNELSSQTKEAQAIQQELRQSQQDLQAEGQRRRESIDALNAQLRELAPGEEPYRAKQDEVIVAKADFNTWLQVEQIKRQNREKTLLTRVYNKISAAAGEVARGKGYDLVLVAEPDLPPNLDQATPEQVQGVLSNRRVLWSSNEADITADVLAKLDADFAAGSGG